MYNVNVLGYKNNLILYCNALFSCGYDKFMKILYTARISYIESINYGVKIKRW